MANKAEKTADALLYEGYLLYPYRKSALKNRKRFNFGLLAPGESFHAEVLLSGIAGEVKATFRFLQLLRRKVFDRNGDCRERLEIGGELFESWDETIERNIETTESYSFCFEEIALEETLPDGESKYRREAESIKGRAAIERAAIRQGLSLLRAEIKNESEKEQFISVHAILQVDGGEFISLLEPAAEFEEETGRLRQKGLFPVMIERRIMLASPIIIYDYPEIAPESEGDFYDATEIDELLALRINTMTDSERREAAALDPRAKAILQQAGSADQMELHGRIRASLPGIGQKVRICPNAKADAFDIFLKGKTGKIEAIEEDIEGRRYFAVALEGDEGAGVWREKPIGHRFFFSEEELEAI